jgi:hypothetical protein
MCLLKIIKEVTLCKKRLHERKVEIGNTNPYSLNYDILLIEVELLQMLIDNLQELISKQMNISLSANTRRALYSIKSTIN